MPYRKRAPAMSAAEFRAARHDVGFSIRDWARLLQISTTTVVNYEQGRTAVTAAVAFRARAYSDPHERCRQLQAQLKAWRHHADTMSWLYERSGEELPPPVIQ